MKPNYRRDAKEKLKEEIDSGLADSLRTPKPPPDLVKDMQFISRKVLLTLLSLEDVSIGYKRQKSGHNLVIQALQSFLNPLMINPQMIIHLLLPTD